jgi:hypothetical protein
MWPFSEMGLSTASLVGTIANWGLFASLLVGFVSTVVISKTTDRKEDLWDHARQESNERIAELNKGTAQLAAEAESARGEIAKANRGAAEANARAVEAQLALEKFKAPRELTPEQQARITFAALPFKGTRFDMAVIPNDPEAIVLVGKIAGPLRAAGWEWVEFNHPNGPFMNVYSWPDLPNVGQFSAVGVSIQLNSDHADEFQNVANELSKVLTAVGFDATVTVADVPGIPNHDTLHILVGKKPQ